MRLSHLSYRHPERSRGIFVAAAFSIPSLIRLHEAPYPPMHGKNRLPISVPTHTPFHLKRKRFLAFARNDRRSRIASHRFSYRRRFQPAETILLNAKKHIQMDALSLISSLFLPAIPANLDYSLKSKQKAHLCRCAFMLISSFLSSRAASSQVLSAFVSLTTVFGMGTGVSSQLSPLNR